MIDCLDDLRARYGPPHPRAIARRHAGLPPEYQDLIRRSPFVVLATSGRDGLALSMRGGPSGFVSIREDGQLVLIDRPGNNRLESLSNLILDPRIGLLFLVPGEGEALRVSGTARVVVASKRTALVVAPTVSFLHCASAISRARLWRAHAGKVGHGAE